MIKQWFQLVPLFITGFFISRIFARAGLAELFVEKLLTRVGKRFPTLLFAILASATLLSLFIPNVLTVLALLPVVEKLREKLSKHSEEYSYLLTPLVLSLIYGANIGGMGSLVGSPANALMLGALSLFNVPGRENIDFVSWLLWGFPLVLIFLVIAWALLVLFLVPRRFFKFELELEQVNLKPLEGEEADPREQENFRKLQRTGSSLTVYTLLFWVALSLASSLFPSLLFMWNGFSLLFGIGFTLFIFMLPVTEEKGIKRPLLYLRDCYTGLPLRGIALAGIAVLVSGLLIWTNIPESLASLVKTYAPTDVSPFWFYLSLTLITIFATELISNTAASVALLPIAYYLSLKLGWHPLPAMMGVALASTCAFMSPLATPATAFAFGGVRGISLKKMFFLGFFVNLIGGVWLAWFLTTIIPWLYGLPLRT